MHASELLHYACRAKDPERQGFFYAELFEGVFLLHPVMSALGIVMVKLNHPQALFHGLLEFWPWDVVWDGWAKRFRRVTPQPSPTSYGHLAVKVAATTEEIVAELDLRGIKHRLEPRKPDLWIPAIDDPEGNMIELFPNIDHMEVPPQALCPPEFARDALAAIKAEFAAKTAHLKPEDGYPLFLE